MGEAATIERGADVLVKYAMMFAARKIHFGIISKAEPSVPHHWRVKNCWGVSFLLKDAEGARQWARDALAAGHTPFVSFRRGGEGTTPNDLLRVLAGQLTKDEELAREWETRFGAVQRP